MGIEPTSEAWEASDYCIKRLGARITSLGLRRSLAGSVYFSFGRGKEPISLIIPVRIS